MPRPRNEPGTLVEEAERAARRTCLGCGAKRDKGQLLRFVAGKGEVVPDVRQALPGRGAYCCRRLPCAKRMLGRKRRLERALRQELIDCRPGLILVESLLKQTGEAEQLASKVSENR